MIRRGGARAIRFSTLDALCRALNCQPGEIIEWVPGELEKDDGND